MAEIDDVLRERRLMTMQAYRRVVPSGELLYNRFDKARDMGAGDGSSVYDACLVLGDVRIGQHVWVGPFTILDGSAAPLTLGDGVTVASGAFLYTHDNALYRISGGRNAPVSGAVTVGDYSFIASNATLSPGVTVGRHCLIAAYAYVKCDVPDYTIFGGVPARQIGMLEPDENGMLTPRYLHGKESKV